MDCLHSAARCVAIPDLMSRILHMRSTPEEQTSRRTDRWGQGLVGCRLSQRVLEHSAKYSKPSKNLNPEIQKTFTGFLALC